MLKKVKSIIAGILCAVMALSLTACYGDTNEWALEINGEKVPSGLYLGYMVSAYSSAANQLSSTEGYSQDALFTMTLEDKNVEQWIKDKALESCKLYVATNKMFNDYKCEISSEVKSTISNQVDTQWESVSQYYETNGCSKTTYSKMIETTYKQNVLFLKIYDKDGTNPVADADIQKYFVENYAKVKIATASLLNSSTYQAISDEEKTELSTKFDKFVERVKNGEDIDTVLDEYSKELEAANSTSTTTDTSQDTTSTDTTSETTSTSEELDVDRNAIIIFKDNEDYPADFNTKVFGMEIGSAEKFEITNFLVFAKREKLEGETKNFTDNRTDALSNMKSSEFADLVKAESEKFEVKLNDNAISRFNAKNIPGNFTSKESNTNN